MSDIQLSEEMQNKLKELNESIAAQMRKMQEEMIEEGGRLFKEATVELFASFPDLYGFSWRQYTPYFNDGDECIFGVYNDYGVGVFEKEFDESTGPDEEERIDSEEYDFSEWSYSYYVKEDRLPDDVPVWKFHAGQAISALVGAIPPDTLKFLFGDHATVYVTRDKTWVTECYHD